ncbi:MAG TPA: hypothetical protein PLP26_11715, partial [Ilumatobacteraceae bacterium]|nr:hypothetical protein [Ilumatobacteraceae bacterium]
MFTTGSKLFFGATALSVVGAIVFAVTTGGPTGLMGTVGMLSLASIFGFLGGINFFNGDGNVPALQPGAQHTAAAAQQPVGSSIWPLVAAVALGGVIVGALSKPIVFKVSIGILLVAAIEWMVQGWSERASADAAYNAGVRKRLLHPLEFPVVGAVGLGVVVYSFSRIMLTVSKEATPWVFMMIGAIIAFGAFLFASKRKIGRGAVLGVCSIGAVALLGVGVASARQGQRTIEVHPTTAGSALCLEGGTEAEIDEHSSQDVSAKSNLDANIYLQSDGTMNARIAGFTKPNDNFDTITVSRSTPVRIRFHNESSSPQRLTARLGTFGEDKEVVMCTTAINPGKEAFLNFKIPK